MTAFEDSKEV